MNRLKTRYQKEVAPALKKEFGYTNVMAIPKIQKIVVNMGLGEATTNLFFSASTFNTRPRFPRSLPLITMTVSFLRIGVASLDIA